MPEQLLLGVCTSLVALDLPLLTAVHFWVQQPLAL